MAAPYFGDYPVNALVSIPWNTNAAAGESITRSADGTLKVFRANANHTTWAVERSSLAGITQTEDFEHPGMHVLTIDLSDDSDPGFWAAGGEIQLAITETTIDDKAVNAFIAAFSIERAGGALARIKDGTSGLAALLAILTNADDTATAIAAFLASVTTTAGNLKASLQEWLEVAPLALASQRPQVDVRAINGVTAAAIRLALSAGAIVPGAAEAGTLSTTQMTTDLAEITDNHYNGRRLIWTTGTLTDQATAITAYSGATGLLTFVAVTEAPAAGDTFVIV